MRGGKNRCGVKDPNKAREGRENNQLIRCASKTGVRSAEVAGQEVLRVVVRE